MTTKLPPMPKPDDIPDDEGDEGRFVAGLLDHTVDLPADWLTRTDEAAEEWSSD